MNRALSAGEENGAAPNRAEIETAVEQDLVVRAAVLELQNEIQGWACRWAPQVPLEALRDLYEAVGLGKKVKL